MKSLLQVIFFLFGTIISVHAQRVCGSAIYRQQILATDPVQKERILNIETQVKTITANRGNTALRDTTRDEIIHIPVVIHVLYKNAVENISDAQVKSQVEALNLDFRMLNNDRVNTPAAFKPMAGDARIQFCLAQVDPRGKNTSGIERQHTDQDFFTTDDRMKMPLKGGIAAWDSKRYLNIWICKLSGASVGYATPPGAAADMDGVVIAYDVFGTTGKLRPVFNKGRTATHEIGHWLGLLHTWGDTDCGDDGVDDTPTQQSYNFGCQTFPKLSSCSPDANGDMFMNFMDFSDDACMHLFTKGQVRKMRAIFAENGVRNSFLSSFACDSTTAQGGALPVTTVKEPLPASLSGTLVYPSPAQESVTIACKEATELTVKTIRIFNSVGAAVFVSQLKQEKTIIPLTNLPAGIYMVQIADGRNQFTKKIIKQ